MNNFVAVTIGDINGIGIEILIDSMIKKKIKNFVLFTNYKIIKNYIKKRKIKLSINVYNLYFKYDKNSLNIYDFKVKNFEDNTIKSLNYAFNLIKKDFFIGMITLPIRKDLIIKKINKNFVGQTEYLQKLDKKETSNMVFSYKNLIISSLTTHININKIERQISKKNFIYNKIISLHKSLITDFGIKKTKILISGLNPHAGENGYIGKQEKLFIDPQIKKLKKLKINISGPVSGDSMLNKNNILNYNCFLFIFHDQALIPFKYISNYSGVNITANLSIIRTSPDHGTAYNLIGKNIASNKSLINCFKTVNKIYKNRLKNDKSKKIIKSKFFN